MIKNFLIINCTGKDDIIALKIDNRYFFKKLQTYIVRYEELSLVVLDFIKKKNIEIEEKF